MSTETPKINALARAAAAALLLTAGFSLPAQARDAVYDCPKVAGLDQTATVVFHPRGMAVEAGEDDGLGDIYFEHRFRYRIEVRAHDMAKPGWTGPMHCQFNGGWDEDLQNNFSQGGWREGSLNHIVYIRNVPRQSKVWIEFGAHEHDSGSDNETLDFTPDPGRRKLQLSVFVEAMKAQTGIGAAKGVMDVTLNKQKRVVGDDSADTNAWLDFVTNVHPDNYNPSAPLPLPVLPKAKPIPGGLIILGDPNSDPQCRDYAMRSVDQYHAAQKAGCGFQPPVWSSDYKMHFDWCQRGKNRDAAAGHLTGRDAKLKACTSGASAAEKRCKDYAQTAMDMIAKAQASNCLGLTGGRWLPDYNAHYAWCMGNPNSPLLGSEAQARAMRVKACTGN